MNFDPEKYYNKQVIKIVHHQWVNLSKPDEPYQFLEWMEWTFEDQSTLVLQNNMDNGKLDAVQLAIDTEKQLVFEQFSGKIQIHSLNVSKATFYEGVTDERLIKITENPTVEEIPYPGCLLFDFGKVNILVGPSKDEGIELERFLEEDIY